jgi:rSAM/selenodomain-associated transferase 2
MKPNNLQISIIIPVLNEENYISKILKYVKSYSNSDNIKEIIVVDGGSTDNTVSIAKEYDTIVVASAKGRAKQMNLGAKVAKANVLYFLHVDTVPPKDFDQYILDAVEKGNEVGCFQMKFDSNNRLLKFFAWFTKINHTLCRGGDQTLFITKKLFERANGFNEAYMIFEDNEFIRRIYSISDFKILPRSVKTSARKYEEIGILRLQFLFGMIHLKNSLGAGPEQLYEYYKRKIVA